MFDLFKKNSLHNATKTEITLNSACFTDGWEKLSILNLYNKIMHEAMDRAVLPDGVEDSAFVATAYDSYSPAKKGLVSLVVLAMAERKRAFYRKVKLQDGSFIFEKSNEQDAIKDGKVGADILELDFRDFYEIDILTLLFSLLSGINQALANGIAVSQAMLIKIHALSEMIENSQNKEALTEQLEQLRESLQGGRMGYIDGKSSVESVKVDTANSSTAIDYVYGMISSVTGMPSSYMFSDVKGGLGDMSNSEERRLDVALKRYYNSIVRGVLYSVFDLHFLYKILIVDIDKMIELFTWLETTALLTNEAKARIITDNTAFKSGDVVKNAKPAKEAVILD